MIMLSKARILFNSKLRNGHCLLIILELRKLRLLIWGNMKGLDSIFIMFKKDISFYALLSSIRIKILGFFRKDC